ncbi:hypothetical protein [Anthocerotibacter panamensis]|uniref:hypothetical protein n=1 Tax=Anthocerotibacter panamensis TaxID=2857077 RepID=UPI001C402C4A|nr:hypothetical protein [Anthocerotibacter panamensis]
MDRLVRQAARNLKIRGLRVERDHSDPESFFVIGPQGFPLDSPSGSWRFSKLEIIQLSENLNNKTP